MRHDRNARIWFSTTTAAEYAERHPITVRRAAEAGGLHGTQRKTKGRWRFHVDCLDAWDRRRRLPARGTIDGRPSRPSSRR